MAGCLSSRSRWCFSSKQDFEIPVIPEFAVYSLDESLRRSHNINIFMKHIVNEHCSECLLSFIEFKQFQKLLLRHILDSDKDSKVLAQRMRENLDVTNRKYRFRTYKQCVVGLDAIHWLMDQITNDNRGEAVDLFVGMIGNGFLMRCTPVPPSGGNKNKKKKKKKTKDHALYRFLWDIVDVDQTTKPFADIIPPSSIVTATTKSIEQKAYQLYRKYVVTDSDLEINISGSIKKSLSKYVHDEGQRMDQITVLAILEVFETLSREMYTYLEQSFARMEPIYKTLSAKESKLLGLKVPNKMRKLHTLQNDEFDKIRSVRFSEQEEVQKGIFLDELQWIDVDEDGKRKSSKSTPSVPSMPLRFRRSSTTLLKAMRHGIESWKSHRHEIKSVDEVDNSATDSLGQTWGIQRSKSMNHL